MRKLFHVIAYNLAKSRATQDGNKYCRVPGYHAAVGYTHSLG